MSGENLDGILVSGAFLGREGEGGGMCRRIVKLTSDEDCKLYCKDYAQTWCLVLCLAISNFIVKIMLRHIVGDLVGLQ